MGINKPPSRRNVSYPPMFGASQHPTIQKEFKPLGFADADYDGYQLQEFIPIIKQICSGINSNNLIESLPFIGLDEQTFLSTVPTTLNDLTPAKGAIEDSFGLLNKIKASINNLSPKKDWKTVLLKPLNESDELIQDRVRGYVSELNQRGITSIKNNIVKIKADTIKHITILQYHLETAKFLLMKLPDIKIKELLTNRISSMALTVMISEQTMQIIEFKEKNVDHLLSVIRDTVLVYVPSWINQLEIHKQTEMSDSLNNTLIVDIIKNQQYIVEQIESLQLKKFK